MHGGTEEIARSQFTADGFVRGLRESIPIAVAVFTYGVVFGVLARQTPLGTIETLLMSVTVFAASAQFVVLDLWRTPLAVIPIVITTVAVNLRHLLLSAALEPWFSRLKRGRIYGTLFFLNDESWGLTMRAHSDGETDGAYLLGSGCLVFVAWVSATGVGLTAGGLISDPTRFGLDMAFAAVYIALLVGVWDGRSDAVPVAVGGGVALVASMVLAGSWHIIIGGLAGSLAGVVRDELGGHQ